MQVPISRSIAACSDGVGTPECSNTASLSCGVVKSSTGGRDGGPPSVRAPDEPPLQATPTDATTVSNALLMLFTHAFTVEDLVVIFFDAAGAGGRLLSVGEMQVIFALTARGEVAESLVELGVVVEALL